MTSKMLSKVGTSPGAAASEHAIPSRLQESWEFLFFCVRILAL